MLKPRTVVPDLVVYLQARTDVLLERIRKRGRAEEKPIRAEYVGEVARAYAEFFFSYSEGPLLIVNASDIDFVGNPQHRRELVEVVKKARVGTSHWSRG
jgi:deoxyguanosine kinase